PTSAAATCSASTGSSFAGGGAYGSFGPAGPLGGASTGSRCGPTGGPTGGGACAGALGLGAYGSSGVLPGCAAAVPAAIATRSRMIGERIRLGYHPRRPASTPHVHAADRRADRHVRDHDFVGARGPDCSDLRIGPVSPRC